MFDFNRDIKLALMATIFHENFTDMTMVMICKLARFDRLDGIYVLQNFKRR